MKRLCPVLLAVLLAPLAGCGSKCHEGFVKGDDGTCVRLRYGSDSAKPDDDTGGDSPADDSGGPTGDAPVLTPNTYSYGTDTEGVAYVAILLGATDPQDDLPGGSVQIHFDNVDLDSRAVVEGVPQTDTDYKNAWLEETALRLWVSPVSPAVHAADITATDLAGNVSELLHLDFAAE